METGFFLFENGWGTRSFGADNGLGAGYGWISYDYVRREGSAYVSGLPEVARAEVCSDGTDNDFDGSIDCDDDACASDPACVMPRGVYDSTESVAIPDDDPAGVRSTISVPDSGAIGALSVSVEITHTYRGDLRVVLLRGDREVVLHDRAGGGEDDLVQTYAVTELDGEDAAGDWTLAVSDHAGYDEGTLVRWKLEIAR